MARKKHRLNKLFFTALSIWLMTVSQVKGAVLISEVAWMGSYKSASQEWIELYNDSTSPVVVDGWNLSDGKNLNIKLKGKINPRTYVVLERGDDNVLPIKAFLVYSGALVNSGATLILRKSNGQIVDKVTGGKNWSNIGGDNNTKDTAQRNLSGRWVTAKPTPGLPTLVNNFNKSGNKTNRLKTRIIKSNKSTNTVNKNKTVRTNNYLKSSGQEKNFRIIAPIQGYVNQDVKLSAELTDKKYKKQLLNYQWNFGNGETAEGKKVTTSYNYPGVYVVVVRGENDKIKAMARHQIEILPIDVQLFIPEAGQVAVKNLSPHEIDISGFKLQGQKTFIFPKDSFLLPQQTILIDNYKLGDFDVKKLKLFDFKGELKSEIFFETANKKSVNVVANEYKQRELKSNGNKVLPQPSTPTVKSVVKPEYKSKSKMSSFKKSSRKNNKSHEQIETNTVFLRPRKITSVSKNAQSDTINFGFADGNTLKKVNLKEDKNRFRQIENFNKNLTAAVSESKNTDIKTVTVFDFNERFYKLLLTLVLGFVITILYYFNSVNDKTKN